jgi:hypothetical protein
MKCTASVPRLWRSCSTRCSPLLPLSLLPTAWMALCGCCKSLTTTWATHGSVGTRFVAVLPHPHPSPFQPRACASSLPPSHALRNQVVARGCPAPGKPVPTSAGVSSASAPPPSVEHPHPMWPRWHVMCACGVVAHSCRWCQVIDAELEVLQVRLRTMAGEMGAKADAVTVTKFTDEMDEAMRRCWGAPEGRVCTGALSRPCQNLSHLALRPAACLRRSSS